MDIHRIKKRLSDKLESDLEAHFRRQITKHGGWPIKFWPISLSGFPDRIVIWRDGRIHFIELKRTGKKPEPLQYRIHERLRLHHCHVKVLAGEADIDSYVKSEGLPGVSGGGTSVHP